MLSREGGKPPNQEAKERAPPDQRALPAHGLLGWGGGENPEGATGGPPKHRVLPANDMQTREGGGPVTIQM